MRSEAHYSSIAGRVKGARLFISPLTRSARLRGVRNEDGASTMSVRFIQFSGVDGPFGCAIVKREGWNMSLANPLRAIHQTTQAAVP